jgi:hypothetical protein
MTLLQFVPDAQRLRWQPAAGALLLDCDDLAREDHLPPLTWVGRCRSRAEWATWQQQLRPTDVAPDVVDAGFARCRATGRQTSRAGISSTVTLLADLDARLEQLDPPSPDPPRDAA